MVGDGLEPGQVEPSDLAAGDAEDLAEGGVGDVGGVVGGGHQPPVPQLDQVVDLSICKLLHAVDLFFNDLTSLAGI